MTTGRIGTGWLRRAVATPRRQHLVAAIPLAAVLALFAAPVVFAGHTLFPPVHTPVAPEDTALRDALLTHLPLPDLVERRSDEGDLPLWNPYIGLGLPLAANNQSLAFAPLRAALSWVEPTSVALSWRLILLGFLGAWALYGFLRLNGVGLAAGAIGAALYASLLLRFVPVRLPLAHYAGTSWTAIGLLALALAFRRRQPAWGAAAALAFGALCLCGHPHVVYFGYLVTGAWVVGEAIAAARADRARRGRAAAAVLGVGGAALGVGALVGAVQILPTLALAAHGTHAFSLAELRGWAHIDPHHLWGTVALGWLLVPLAVLQRRWLPALWLVLLLAALSIMSGGVVLDLFHRVMPFFDNFKVRTKYYAMPYAILVPGLVAFGCHRVLTLVRRARPAVRTAVTAGLATVALSAVIGAPFGEIWAGQAPDEEVRPRLACLDAVRRTAGPLGRLSRYRTRALPPNMASLWQVHDLHVSSGQMDERYERLMVALNPATAEPATQDGEIRPIPSPALLSLPLLDLLGVRALLAGEPVRAPGWELVEADPDDLCYRVTPGWWVYRNAEALPRAWLAPGLRALPDDGAVIDALLSPRLDPRGCALVVAGDEAAPVGAGAAGSAEDGACDRRDLGAVEVVRYRDDAVDLAVEARTDAVLVLADAWGPAWVATVDGAPVPIERAHLILRGVRVPAGAHAVRFAYRPAAVRRGLAGSAVGLAAALGWALFGLGRAWRARRSRLASGSAIV